MPTDEQVNEYTNYLN